MHASLTSLRPLYFVVAASARWRICVVWSRLAPAARRGRYGGGEIVIDGRNVATHEGENCKPGGKCDRDLTAALCSSIGPYDAGVRPSARPRTVYLYLVT